MSFQWIVGRAGSGKTRRMYGEVVRKSLEAADRTFLVLVPEQFTLETQKELVALHPSKGLLNIEVLSFQRLAFRLYDGLGTGERKILQETGKGMVIRRLLGEEGYLQLPSLVEKRGYLDKMCDLLDEFQQYGVAPQDLEAVLEEGVDKVLGDKLRDAGRLYARYRSYMEEHYLTLESILDLLPEAVEKADWMEKAEIHLDGFHGFNPSQTKVLEAALRKVSHASISLLVDPELVEGRGEPEDGSGELFQESLETWRSVEALLHTLGVDRLPTIRLEVEEGKRFRSKALVHLEKNLFRYPYAKFAGKPAGIHLGYGAHMRMEVRAMADTLSRLLQEKGLRYRDVAVLCTDLEGYKPVIRRTFEQYGIAVFMDQKSRVLEHPFFRFLFSSLDVVIRDFRYEDVFAAVKTGYLPLDQAAGDRLENYALAWGIKGRRKWSVPFHKPVPYEGPGEDLALERLEGSRAQLWEAYRSLGESLAGSRKVRGKAEALFRWMAWLGLEERLGEEARDLEAKGRLEEALFYKRIWPAALELLDQMVEILGGEGVGNQGFADLLEAGASRVELGLIPPGLDQVVVGDLERTRIKEVKVLFVLGLNEGKVPKGDRPPGYLTDQEKAVLKGRDVVLAPDRKQMLIRDQLNIYGGFCRAGERLYASFAQADLEGKALRPAPLANNLRKMFPQARVTDFAKAYEGRFVVNRPLPTMMHWLSMLRDNRSGSFATQAKAFHAWMSGQEAYAPLMEKALQGMAHENREAPLDGRISGLLYGPALVNSVSRLEQFAGCPFSHFVKYGLQARERSLYGVAPPDMGNLFHKALEILVRELMEEGRDLCGLDPEQRDLRVEEAVRKALDAEVRDVFRSTFRTGYLVKRLTRILKKSVWAMQVQLGKGDFRPYKAEYRFGGGKDLPPSLQVPLSNRTVMRLQGIVDRVDISQEGDRCWLSVVDYKSGSRDLDLTALYHGLQLQLFVYLRALLEIESLERTQEVLPAGVWYCQIQDPMLKMEGEPTEETLRQETEKAFKLKGLVLEEEEVYRRYERDMGSRSTVIPVSLNKDGRVSAAASTATLEEFAAILEYVGGKVKELGDGIVEGNIAIVPYKYQERKACDYCAYAGICQFDEGLRENAYKLIKKSEKEQVMLDMKNKNEQ
ncbi:PD-(D/E)XK nuclease family protein [Anaerotalea alkaliphila]|uniref:UvrD-like helicase C-terminal domain-containing protein n=1 Tax=Anaerotalea alkaliphila TaxID=2662126 RepID=A0A7X5HTT3_9FIRM|nr:PD-(D/E)XK nuclease family protein [Anaerotalea alkaliphila]NDL66532.1 hypothetical protein [Anaerotalea alkaliphila]